MSRALALVFTASFGAMWSFYLLLSVVPRYATSQGAGGVGAGGMTGALMGATVAAELAVPRLVARFGYRSVLAVGLVLLGLPALALRAATSLPAIAGICAVRGMGLAILFVAGSALVPAIAPPARRASALGVYGLVVGVPAVVALPLGLWLAERVGYSVVFVLAAVAALGGLAALPGVPSRTRAPGGAGAGRGVVAALRMPALVRPSAVFALAAMAAGAVVTFLPLAVARGSEGLAAAALFAQAASTAGARWWAGHHGDRHGSAGLLLPAVLAAAVGLSALTLVDRPAAVVLGMLLLGAGFGVAQNASLALMFEHAPPGEYDAVSAVWNIAYDAGLAVGGAGFGVLAARAGYPAAFGVSGALMAVALAPAWRDRAWLRPVPETPDAPDAAPVGDQVGPAAR
jgi:predicted MFS family arabinose efflux permease